MAHTVWERRRQRESAGFGQFFSDSFISILIGCGLVAAAFWYFTIYIKSPQVALQHYLRAVNSGNTDVQWLNLSAGSKKFFGDQSTYSAKYPMAYGLSARLADFSFGIATDSGDTWEVDATLKVRQVTTLMLSAETESFTNHYVLKKETDGWKIDLRNPKTKVDLSKAVDRQTPALR
jgi:hypothetical protein